MKKVTTEKLREAKAGGEGAAKKGSACACGLPRSRSMVSGLKRLGARRALQQCQPYSSANTSKPDVWCH